MKPRRICNYRLGNYIIICLLCLMLGAFFVVRPDAAHGEEAGTGEAGTGEAEAAAGLADDSAENAGDTEEAGDTEDAGEAGDTGDAGDAGESEDTDLLTDISLGISSIPSGNRVWFYNMSGGQYGSDFIIVESQGHWGLIDTGNRYDNHIEDSDGTIYPAPRSLQLSNQAKGKNGRDAATWMIETLGVSHLDFIIATHAHSDHIGGIPEIAELRYIDGDVEGGEVRHLIDENTVYLYKAYHHIDSLHDDLGIETRSDSWHSQAFCYQAVKSVTNQGATAIDISQNRMTSAGPQPALNYSSELSKLSSSSKIKSPSYTQGSYDDWFDDYIRFGFGDFTITLYNLFSVSGAINENVNSVAALITDGNRELYTAGDINVEQEIEQKIARTISSEYGNVDALKISHHACNKSTPMELLDLFQPSTAFITTHITSTTGEMSGSGIQQAILHYGKSGYNTVFYNVGTSDKALVYDFSDGTVSQFFGEKEDGYLSSASPCIDQTTLSGGWTDWVQRVSDEGTRSEIYYFDDGEARTGWMKRWEKWFYLDPDDYGRMHRGWLTIDEKTYYLSPETTKRFRDGEMVKGPMEIDGETYLFKEDGSLATGWMKNGDLWNYYDAEGIPVIGWQEIKDKWYYFDEGGVMQTGWFKEQTPGGPIYYHLHEKNGDAAVGWMQIDDEWYYFNPDRKMATGWIKDGDGWYYLNPPNGKMVTGWKQIDKKWYFFNSSGKKQTGWVNDAGRKYYMDSKGVMTHGWKKIGGKWYYFGWPNDPYSGAMRTEWVKINNNWYYMGTDGAMKRGGYEVNGRKYYFGWESDRDSGAMRRGWVKEKDNWYYYGDVTNMDSGAMKTGWINDGKNWYYLDSSGIMMSNEYVRGWWLNPNGSWTYPYRASWQGHDDIWWYGDESGWYAADKTYKIDGVEYSFDDGGWLEVEK